MQSENSWIGDDLLTASQDGGIPAAPRSFGHRHRRARARGCARTCWPGLAGSCAETICRRETTEGDSESIGLLIAPRSEAWGSLPVAASLSGRGDDVQAGRGSWTRFAPIVGVFCAMAARPHGRSARGVIGVIDSNSSLSPVWQAWELRDSPSRPAGSGQSDGAGLVEGGLRRVQQVGGGI